MIPLEIGDVDRWLHGSITDAAHLLELAPTEVFDAAPAVSAPPGKPVQSRLL